MNHSNKTQEFTADDAQAILTQISVPQTTGVAGD
jgi:hypothetical protein